MVCSAICSASRLSSSSACFADSSFSADCLSNASSAILLVSAAFRASRACASARAASSSRFFRSVSNVSFCFRSGASCLRRSSRVFLRVSCVFLLLSVSRASSCCACSVVPRACLNDVSAARRSARRLANAAASAPAGICSFAGPVGIVGSFTATTAWAVGGISAVGATTTVGVTGGVGVDAGVSGGVPSEGCLAGSSTFGGITGGTTPIS